MYKALKSFSGVISMRKGEVKDIQDDFIVDDLKKAGYIEDYIEEPQQEVEQKTVEENNVEENKEEENKKVKKVEKKTTKKKK